MDIRGKIKYLKITAGLLAAVLMVPAGYGTAHAGKTGGNYEILDDFVGAGGETEIGAGTYDSQGNITVFSSTWTTTSGDLYGGHLPNINNIPLAPTPSSPSDGEEIGDTTPTLTWVYHDDDNDDQHAFQVEVSTKSDFSIIASSSNVVQTSQQSWTCGELSLNTTYYWRVKTQDDNWYEWGDWSNTVSFYLDNVAPAAIETISANSTDADGGILLQWQAPGDDGWSGTLGTASEPAAFRIQYEFGASPVWDKDNYDVEISTYGIAPYSVSYYITNLTTETTYFFRVWTKDGEGNWSDISAGATTWVRIRPGAVDDFDGQAELDGSVTLSWSAPGDDGSVNSIANGRYRIRWSTDSVVDWNSGTWTDYTNKYNLEFATNTVPDAAQVRSVTGLTGDATYYFRIWTRDENTGANAPGNWSYISNGATVTVNDVLGVDIATVTVNLGNLEVGGSTIVPAAVPTQNISNIPVNFGIRASTNTVGTPWKLGSTPGMDQLVIYCLVNQAKPQVSDFGPEDILTYSYQTSTAQKFSMGGDSGVEVPVDEKKNTWYLIKMPTISNTADEQSLVIEIRAEKP